jgi:selenocysteine lyase/cysteine desulfurase
MGPLGIGLLYIAPGVEEELLPLRQGGTGTRSEVDQQPDSLPDKYESGTHNVPGIIGLSAGIAHVNKIGLAALRRHLHALTERMLGAFRELDGVHVLGPADAARQLGVVSITIKGFDPQEAAAMLDSAYGIQARPGIHCAPRMHEALGTLKSGGTLRFSFSAHTTESDIDAAIRAVTELAGSAMTG